jgi:hypothetical protein
VLAGLGFKSVGIGRSTSRGMGDPAVETIADATRMWRPQRFLAGSLVFVCLTVLTGARAQAQDAVSTRADELRRRRVAKLEQGVPAEEDSGLEKALLYLEKKRPDEVLSVRWKDFYPRFGNLSSGSGFAPGIRYFKSKINGTPLTIESSFANSFRGYRVLDLQFGRFYRIAPDFFIGPPEFGAPFEFREPSPQEVDRERSFLYLDLRSRYLPQEVYYGPGQESNPGDRTSYLQEDFTADVVAGYQFKSWLAAGVRLGHRRHNIEPGTDDRFPPTQDVFDDGEAPGLAQQPPFLVAGAGIFLDYSDQPGDPHSGGILGVTFGRFDDRNGAGFAFTRYAVDARQYLPLGSPQRVLALRFHTSIGDPDRGNRVPFYLQPDLGGQAMLRGYREFRFRDDNLVFLAAEYRWEPAPAFEMALFYDAGKVFPEGEAWALTHLRKSAGMGFRFKTARRTFLRLDIGRSDEGTRLQFRFGPAF